jgi:hypothetical protein
MSHGHSRKLRVGATLAPVMCLALALASPASADPIPPGAKKPVRQYNTTITVQKLAGTSIACVNARSNPVGYVLQKTRYSGHRYVDARGVGFSGLYQTWTQVAGWKTVVGPFSVHSQASWKECLGRVG